MAFQARSHLGPYWFHSSSDILHSASGDPSTPQKCARVAALRVGDAPYRHPIGLAVDDCTPSCNSPGNKALADQEADEVLF